METKRLELVAFSTFFVILSVLIFFVFQPFIRILVLSAVLAVLFHPLYVKLLKVFKNRNFVSGLLVIVALVFLIIPLMFLGLQILSQVHNFFALTQSGQGQIIISLQRNIDLIIQNVIPGFSFSLSGSINTVLIFISDNLTGLISQTTYIFFEVFFLLLTFFVFMKDGEKMLDSFITLSPFRKEQDLEIIHSVNRTITAVVRGVLFVGLIRFALLAIAFYFLGIPNALLWGIIGGIIGAVPGLGTPFAIIPALLYTLLYGNTYTVITLISITILLMFFVDNLLSTYFFGKGFNIQPIFVLFSILGGIIMFGPLGFIFGPIILSLFISAIDMYKILILKTSRGN
jgi:predicted PurR-regulated permease PerM